MLSAHSTNQAVPLALGNEFLPVNLGDVPWMHSGLTYVLQGCGLTIIHQVLCMEHFTHTSNISLFSHLP